ncbi:MAG: CopD family protein [Vulcanibacillus sp.]
MKKFSVLTWTSLIILILTGIYAIYSNKDKLTPVFQESSGIVLFVKLILVAVMIVILFLKVFVYGPKMNSFISPATPQNQENQMEMTKTSNTAKVLSKTHLYAGIIIVILVVILSGLLEK